MQDEKINLQESDKPKPHGRLDVLNKQIHRQDHRPIAPSVDLYLDLG